MYVVVYYEPLKDETPDDGASLVKDIDNSMDEGYDNLTVTFGGPK